MKWVVVAIMSLAGTFGTAPGWPRAMLTDQPTPKQPEEKPASEKSALDKQLEAIDSSAKEIKTLRGKFVQRKHTPLLKKQLESSGTVAIKGDKTRWETAEPRRSVMTIDQRGLRIFYPEQKVVEVFEVGDDVREFAGSPLPRLDKLRKAFEIAALKASEVGGKDDDTSVLAVELLPRSEELKKHVAHVRVLIDSSIPAIRRMEITDVDGERTEIEFKDIKINASLEDADLALDVPPGTREVYPLGEPSTEPPKEKDK
jgi:outer membrane lipoprotein-sorting protein